VAQRHKGGPHDAVAYEQFLREIGYIVPVGLPFSIGTSDVDPEISSIAGPQLVVPATNARYALNAANARWGSLYDALYGTDVLSEDGGATRAGVQSRARGQGHGVRGPLPGQGPAAGRGSHADVLEYRLVRKDAGGMWKSNCRTA
jgi:malate synthase